MKLILLVESNWKQFENMTSKLEKPSVLLNTEKCEENEEYEIISNSIKSLADSEIEVMVIKYSGKDSIARSLGDICPEMIIPVSYNVASPNYIEHPVETFLDLVRLLEKETIDKCQKCN